MRWLICVMLAAWLLAGVRTGQCDKEQAVLSKIDHLVYAAPDLARAQSL